jgi:CBS domain-containing protein
VRISDLMTRDPVFCTPETTAQEAARLMRDNDCGSIPVVEDTVKRRLVAVVTDRDLAVRGLAEGLGPDTPVRQLWTERPATALPDDEVEIVRTVMMQQQVRRVPVIDKDGAIVGIVAQADIAREDSAASDRDLGQIVEAISEPNPKA